MKRVKWFLGLSAIASAAYAIRALFTQKSALEALGELEERRAEPDPEALAAGIEQTDRIGLDLDRLREMQSGAYKPLVEYLTYIQVQRGDDRSLVFVRQKDLESLAALIGGSKEDFVEEFKQLGVLLSMN